MNMLNCAHLCTEKCMHCEPVMLTVEEEFGIPPLMPFDNLSLKAGMRTSLGNVGLCYCYTHAHAC